MNEDLIRLCPKCNKTVIHKKKEYRNKAVKLNQICLECSNNKRKGTRTGSENPFYGKKHSKETIEKLKQRKPTHTNEEWIKKLKSDSWKGDKNPSWKTTNFNKWKEKYGEERASELESNRRQKISIKSAGKNNPMYGKPPPKGSGVGLSGWYNNHYFRSIRELSYIIKVLEKDNCSWKSAECKEFKIPYIDEKGNDRTYYPDFIVNEKYLVEVKPEKLMLLKITKLKTEAAHKFCQERNLVYVLSDCVPLNTKEIRELVRSNKIQFLEKHAKRIKEKYGY